MAALAISGSVGRSDARERVYEGTGSYTMGDTDTKQEAQAQAKLRATAAALDEAGTYVEHILTGLSSERNGRFRGEYTESITAITAGVVRILDEDVQYTSTFHVQSGNVTWVCRIKAHIDEKEVLERVRRIRDNQQILAGLEEVQAENARQLRELDRLRNENERLRTHVSSAAGRPDRSGSKPAQHLAAVSRERQQAVERLRAVEHFQSGLYAQAGGNERAARQEYAQSVKLGYEVPEAYFGLPTLSVRGYGDLIGLGRIYADHGDRYYYFTFLRAGYLFFGSVGLDSSFFESVSGYAGESDEGGPYFAFPLGIFVSLLQTDYYLLNASGRAYLFNRYYYYETEKGRAFPRFLDVALEWRSLLHSARVGYIWQSKTDASGLNLGGIYLNLHFGLEAVVPAKR